MDFSDSYLGQLRKRIGSELVLMPGAMIALQRPGDGRVLFTRRADDGTWCLPAGAAEPEGSDPHPDHEETTKVEFADPASPPSPIHGPTARALELPNAYLRSGQFQLR